MIYVFKVISYVKITNKRTELDEQGNPYPILYMRLER